MAEALILDAEAVNALAHPKERGALLGRSRAILKVALDQRGLVRVPAPVLAEVCRGPRFDPAIDRLLTGHGVLVFDLTRDIARSAGHLLARARLSSAHAIDAFVVATALAFDRAVIATGDPREIQRLAAPFRQVRVFAI
jgi:PIN domain